MNEPDDFGFKECITFTTILCVLFIVVCAMDLWDWINDHF